MPANVGSPPAYVGALRTGSRCRRARSQAPNDCGDWTDARRAEDLLRCSAGSMGMPGTRAACVASDDLLGLRARVSEQELFATEGASNMTAPIGRHRIHVNGKNRVPIFLLYSCASFTSAGPAHTQMFRAVGNRQLHSHSAEPTSTRNMRDLVVFLRTHHVIPSACSRPLRFSAQCVAPPAFHATPSWANAGPRAIEPS